MATGSEKSSAPSGEQITLTSSDGRDFLISKSAAALSPTIQKILDDSSPAGNQVSLPNVDGVALATVAAYLTAHAADDDEEKKKFDSAFLAGNQMDINVLLDVVLAADYLEMVGLMDMADEKVADRMTNKSVDWVRRAFGIENDLTAAQIEEMRRQYPWAWEGVEPDNND